MVLVLDFGSQYTRLISRRISQLGVHSEVIHHNSWSDNTLDKLKPEVVILSGGPGCVLLDKTIDIKELCKRTYVFGVCYGMHLIAKQFGGSVETGGSSEFGMQRIIWNLQPPKGVPKEHNVWMSHRDSVINIPSGFEVSAKSQDGVIAAMTNGRVMAVQFHPEVTHTEYGSEVLKYFLFEVAKIKPEQNINQNIYKKIEQTVKLDDKVLCAVSGGVDSTVTACVLKKKLGNQVSFVFVDNGLLREGEPEEVVDIYKKLKIDIHVIDAKKDFIQALRGVTDPEEKRKIIGKTFIDTFKNFTKDRHYKWLSQGTLYPDVIESGGAVIKSHHNVGGLPKVLGINLLEPLKSLFKDEVRKLGLTLGIPNWILKRHPFPGPGLAVRIPGEVTYEKLSILKRADKVFIDALKKDGLYDKIWQAFCVLIPVKTVGVQGDKRSYEYTICIRAVVSDDGMTADWYEFDPKFMKKVSNLIVNNVPGINRVLYDVTSKPPSTIEWE